MATIFSGLATASVVCVDYLLLPYLITSTRAEFFYSSTYFPFPELLFLYSCMFGAETGMRYLVLERTSWAVRLQRQPPSILIGGMVLISFFWTFTPLLLFAAVQAINSSHALTGFVLFSFCILEGGLKVGHSIFSGVLFSQYLDAIALKQIVQTGEQLVGLSRCFFSSCLFIIAGAVQYHQVGNQMSNYYLTLNKIKLTLSSVSMHRRVYADLSMLFLPISIRVCVECTCAYILLRDFSSTRQHCQ